MSGDFLSFCRSHGIIIDTLPPVGMWKRYPTENHPKKKNASVLYKGDNEGGVIQDWAVHAEAIAWRSERDRPQSAEERRKATQQMRDREETQERQWKRAADKAAEMLKTATPSHHGYPMLKGLTEREVVLVLPDSSMFVPMRSLGENDLVGAQTIRWLTDERRWEKKFISGMRAKGAVFRFGKPTAAETIVCEGWATGASLRDAVAMLKLDMSVLVAFSAGNIMAVADRVKGRRAFVFADNDESQAGEKSARATGLPWTMAPDVGDDANDYAIKAGKRALAALVLALRKKKP